MTPEQKQRAMQMLRRFSQTTPMTRTADNAAVAMAALLQDLVDAPAPEPVARVTGYYAGHLSIATVDGRVLSTDTALYAAPPAPSVQDGWKLVPVEPTPEPFGYFKAEPFGWTDCAETDDGAIALYTAPPAPSVPDMRLTGQWESSRIADYNRGWNECRQAMLSAAPTPAEAPAQDFEDALEQAFWDFDARHKGYKKTIRPISERDAFKQVLRNFMHEHGGAEAPADVARDGWKNAAEWLRNNYQDYPNISSLCEAMVAQSANNGGN